MAARLLCSNPASYQGCSCKDCVSYISAYSGGHAESARYCGRLAGSQDMKCFEWSVIRREFLSNPFMGLLVMLWNITIRLAWQMRRRNRGALTDIYAVISIQDSHTSGFGVQFSENQFCKGVLTLIFDDIVTEVEGAVLFDDEMAESVIDFIEKYRRSVDTLLVHCYAGQSARLRLRCSAVTMANILKKVRPISISMMCWRVHG